MTREEYERMSRWAKLAETWFEKATHILSKGGRDASPDVRAVTSYEVQRLLTGVLDNAERLVPFLEPGEVDEVQRCADSFRAAVRAQRLAGKLDDVAGRTPEEASAFVEKAAALRGHVGAEA